MPDPIVGIYDQILDTEWSELIESADGKILMVRLEKLEADQAISYLVAYLARQVEEVLRAAGTKSDHVDLVNAVLEFLSQQSELEFLEKRRLVNSDQDWLLEISKPEVIANSLPRPETPLSCSSLFTGSSGGPQLAHELDREIRSSNRIDALLSFIKWAGLRLLQEAFEEFASRGGELRLLTTSYMGASDPNAVEWLAKLPGAQVKVSYDTKHTRLHAKAHYFHRDSGFSTAYIGSANMSKPAMTSGLEWNLKVTAQESPHIMARCIAEFESYWNSPVFEYLDPENPKKLRAAISVERKPPKDPSSLSFFLDIKPYGYQEEVLEKLRAARETHGHYRNLIVAATGTGKTIISAFDYRRLLQEEKRSRLLFIAHRQEILEQSAECFRHVLRNRNFGDLWVGSYKPDSTDHLFCSIQTFNSQRLWESIPPDFYDFIVVDEVHHGAAESYRALLEELSPRILLGLTATPERADEQSIEHYFDRPFAAEIRLPDALDLKLLCPFQYFAISDSVSYEGIAWTRGRYAEADLDNLLTGNDARAQNVVEALQRYEPSRTISGDIDRERLKGLGFCVSKNHAAYMAKAFNKSGIPAGSLDSDTNEDERHELREKLRSGELNFLFVIDIFNEGVDIPEINCVMFLRPTESPVVFLQQLGRGLRHADEKECLTVLDFVGQCHKKFRYDLRFRALLPRDRRIEKEVEAGFPHLPPGCSVSLEKQARRIILENIRHTYKDASVRIYEQLRTFESEIGRPLNFTNFIEAYQEDPVSLLSKRSWSEWKKSAGVGEVVDYPDKKLLKGALARTSCLRSPRYLKWLSELASGRLPRAIDKSEFAPMAHYLLWNRSGEGLGVDSWSQSFERLKKNTTFLRDLGEITEYALQFSVPERIVELPYECPLELHGKYFMREITSAFGKADLETTGPTGTGVIHLKEIRTYLLLITFQKSEKDYSPTTMYRDYVISRDLIHWESQSGTAEKHSTGQNFINQRENGYTILVLTRPEKEIGQLAAPYIFLGPADYVEHRGERPIAITWKLRDSMPSETEQEGKKVSGL